MRALGGRESNNETVTVRAAITTDGIGKPRVANRQQPSWRGETRILSQKEKKNRTPIRTKPPPTAQNNHEKNDIMPEEPNNGLLERPSTDLGLEDQLIHAE